MRTGVRGPVGTPRHRTGTAQHCHDLDCLAVPIIGGIVPPPTVPLNPGTTAGELLPRATGATHDITSTTATG